ncbi:MAG TPA: hypothetical protein VGQ61_12475 [Candidatus Angelobacter sp.]|nr:hypothetical protein [Candidatus Angelobacter sp.]
MKRSKGQFLMVAAMVLAGLALPARAFADDDFGRIVHHIEANYHVHRQHRWVMGLAGFTVKFWHIAGVKSLKGAIFENQPFVNVASDTRFDEVVRAAMDSGWQPLIQSWDRHSGERTYIYAQEVSSKKGTDMKLLLVSLESNEAVVLQVKVDPKKLDEFIEETSAGHHRNRPMPNEEAAPQNEDRVELTAASPQSWDGICLFLHDDAQLVQP